MHYIQQLDMTVASLYGLKVRAVKGTKEAVTPKTPVPFIAHMHLERVTYDDFFKYWTGYALFFEPDECFKTGTKMLC